MATRLASTSIHNTNPSAPYTGAPAYPTHSGTAIVEAQQTVGDGFDEGVFYGDRVRHRIGSPLAPAATVPGGGGWGGIAAPVSILDLYSGSSGPSVRGAVAHLYVSNQTTPNSILIDGISSKITGGEGDQLLIAPLQHIPQVTSGIATNRYGTVIRDKLVVHNATPSPTAEAFMGFHVAVGPNLSVESAPLMSIRARHQSPFTGPSSYLGFFCGPTNTGNIISPGSTTSYNTSSDYRLKENVTPIESGLDIISALKPRKWKWKDSDELAVGFVAHEVQEIGAQHPELSDFGVSGTKDEVRRYGNLIDSEGNSKLDGDGQVIEIPEPNSDDAATYAEEGYTWTETRNEPVYQSMDASFMISPLVAAVKELKAIVDQQQATITALEQRITTLESAQ